MLKHLKMLVISIFLIGLILSCGKMPDKKVGVIIPLTGNLGFVGESFRNGMLIAEVDKNDQQSIFDFQDSQNDPKIGLSIYQKMTQISGYKVIVPIMSSVAAAIVSQKPSITILTSVVSDSRITQTDHVFRYFLSSDKETRRMAEFMVKQKKMKTAIIYVNDDFGQDAYNCFKSVYTVNGGSLVYEEGYDKSITNFRTVINKAVTGKPEAVYIIGYGNALGILSKQLRETKYKGDIMTFSSFSAPKVIEQAGTAAEGVYLTATPFDANNPISDKQKKFIEAYRVKYGKLPDHYAAFGYDVADLLLSAIGSGKIDMHKLEANLSGQRNYQGLMGNVSCDEQRDFQFTANVKIIKNGKPEIVE